MDVLVNSAGIGIGGSFADQDTKRIALQLDVNLRATLIVTRESLPLLRASRGQVITLASIAGTIPTPGLAVYGATKAALIAWTSSLNREEAEHGVRATAISPAFVATRMTEWTGLPDDEQIQPERHRRARASRALAQPPGARPEHRRRAPRRRRSESASSFSRTAVSSSSTETVPSNRSTIVPLPSTRNVHGSVGRFHSRIQRLYPFAGSLSSNTSTWMKRTFSPSKRRADLLDDVDDGPAGPARAELRRREASRRTEPSPRASRRPSSGAVTRPVESES